MLRTLFFSALCGATLSADTVIGDFGAGTVSGFVTGGYVFAGQTFTVPTPDNVLTTWQIHMQHRDAQNIGFQIFAFTGGAIRFAALYDTLVPLAAEGGVIDLTGLNLPLVSGQTYIAAYHLFSAEPSLAFFDHDVYSGGQATFTVGGLADLENRLGAFLSTAFDDHDDHRGWKYSQASHYQQTILSPVRL